MPQRAAGDADAGTLENLERERAQLITVMFESELDQGQRQTKIESIRRRLIDLERMVLRDDSLKSKATPIVQPARANYDLTFLAHSALEKNQTMLDNWMEQVGLSTQAIMTSQLRENLMVKLSIGQ